MLSPDHFTMMPWTGRNPTVCDLDLGHHWFGFPWGLRTGQICVSGWVFVRHYLLHLWQTFQQSYWWSYSFAVRCLHLDSSLNIVHVMEKHFKRQHEIQSFALSSLAWNVQDFQKSLFVCRQVTTSQKSVHFEWHLLQSSYRRLYELGLVFDSCFSCWHWCLAC